MVNKRKFQITNNKKVLHKIGKQWVTVSAFALAILGAGAMTTVTTHADTVQNAQPKSEQVQPKQIQYSAGMMHRALMQSAPKSVAQSSSASQSASAGSSASSASSSASTASSAVRPKMLLGGAQQYPTDSNDDLTSGNLTVDSDTTSAQNAYASADDRYSSDASARANNVLTGDLANMNTAKGNLDHAGDNWNGFSKAQRNQYNFDLQNIQPGNMQFMINLEYKNKARIDRQIRDNLNAVRRLADMFQADQNKFDADWAPKKQPAKPQTPQKKTQHTAQVSAIRYWGNSTVTFYSDGNVNISGGLIGVPSDFAKQTINYRSDQGLPYKSASQLTNSDYAKAISWDDNVNINSYDQTFSDFYDNAQVDHLVPLSNVKHIILSDVKLPQYAGGMFQNLPNLQAVTGTMQNSDTDNMETMFRNDPKLTNVSAMDNMKLPADISNMFENDTALGDSANDTLNSMDYSNVSNAGYFLHHTGFSNVAPSNWKNFHPTSIADTFANMGNLVHINLTGVDTSKVNDFSSLFVEDPKLQSIDVSPLNTQSADTMEYMFARDTALSDIKGLDDFNTANVGSMKHMFANDPALKSLDLSSFDTTATKGYMSDMFLSDTDLQNLDLGKKSGLDSNTALPDPWMTDSNSKSKRRGNRNFKAFTLNDGKSHKGAWTRDAKVVNYFNQDTGDYLGHQKFFTGIQDWTNGNLHHFAPNHDVKGMTAVSDPEFSYDTTISPVEYVGDQASDFVKYVDDGKVVAVGYDKSGKDDQPDNDVLNYGSDFGKGKYDNLPSDYHISKQEISDVNSDFSMISNGNFGGTQLNIPVKSNAQLGLSRIQVRYLDADAKDKTVLTVPVATGKIGSQFDLIAYEDKIPWNYELYDIRNQQYSFQHSDQTVDILLSEVKGRININYIDDNNGNTIKQIQLQDKIDTPFHDLAKYLSIPEGYEYKDVQNASVDKFGKEDQNINVHLLEQDPAKLTISTITINYKDGDKVVGSKQLSRPVSTDFDIGQYLDVPAGYQYKGIRNDVDGFDYDDHTVDVLVKKVAPAKVAKSSITINYLDGQKVVASSKDTEPVSTDYDLGEHLNVPAGYEYAGIKHDTDDFHYDDQTIDVLVRKVNPAKVAKSTITVNYVANGKQISSKKVTEPVSTDFDVGEYLSVPAGYEYSHVTGTTDHFKYTDQTVNIKLIKRPEAKVAQSTITVQYQNRANGQVVDSTKTTEPVSTDYDVYSDMNVPDGYVYDGVRNDTDHFTYADQTVTVLVDKDSNKEVPLPSSASSKASSKAKPASSKAPSGSSKASSASQSAPSSKASSAVKPSSKASAKPSSASVAPSSASVKPSSASSAKPSSASSAVAPSSASVPASSVAPVVPSSSVPASSAVPSSVTSQSYVAPSSVSSKAPSSATSGLKSKASLSSQASSAGSSVSPVHSSSASSAVKSAPESTEAVSSVANHVHVRAHSAVKSTAVKGSQHGRELAQTDESHAGVFSAIVAVIVGAVAGLYDSLKKRRHE